MVTVTVPKELSKNKNLIAVPRDLYEEFLVWHKKIKSAKIFKPTKSEINDLRRARQDFARNNYLSLEEFVHEMDRFHSSKSSKKN